MTSLPTAVEPVKVSLSTPAWFVSAAPQSGPNPVSALTTPAGTCRWKISATCSAASGASSAVLRTIVFPVHSAMEIFSAASATGVFHGITAATTPSGSRTV